MIHVQIFHLDRNILLCNKDKLAISCSCKLYHFSAFQALTFMKLSFKTLINLVDKSKKENPMNNPKVPPIDPMTPVIS